MDIEMMLLLRDYYKMAAPWRWLAQQMFPVLKVIACQPEENEAAIARHFANLTMGTKGGYKSAGL